MLVLPLHDSSCLWCQLNIAYKDFLYAVQFEQQSSDVAFNSTSHLLCWMVVCFCSFVSLRAMHLYPKIILVEFVAKQPVWSLNTPRLLSDKTWNFLSGIAMQILLSLRIFATFSILVAVHSFDGESANKEHSLVLIASPA